MRIFLVGFMGCGKTSLGKRLARKINYSFIDIDASVEEITKRTIDDIISMDGEEVFRKIEREALLSTREMENVVISTGGGTPCYFDNMQQINKMGTSVYLKMSYLSLAKRLDDSDNKRPLLKNFSGQKLVDKVKIMLSEREKYYCQAACVIKGENAKPNHIVSLVFG